MSKKFDWNTYIEREGIRVLQSLPEGWSFIRNATNHPKTFRWASNNKSMFSPEREYGLVYTGNTTMSEGTSKGE